MSKILNIQCLPSGPFETNAYLLVCERSLKGAIIDPSPGSFDLLKKNIAPSIEIQAIFLTHSHWDHIGDLASCHRQWPCPIYVHPLDRQNVVTPGSDGLPLMIEIEGVEPDHMFSDQQILSIGELSITVIETPGHSPGSVCLYIPGHQVVFSGDVLFKGSIGNLSLPTCNRPDMWASLEKLQQLPLQTLVYPGHGPQTSIGEERWLPRARELFN